MIQVKTHKRNGRIVRSHMRKKKANAKAKYGTKEKNMSDWKKSGVGEDYDDKTDYNKVIRERGIVSKGKKKRSNMKKKKC